MEEGKGEERTCAAVKGSSLRKALYLAVPLPSQNF